jgi:hypothetical protein
MRVAIVRNGVIELPVADVDARVEERGGIPVIVAESVAPIDVHDVRAAVERTR